VGWLTRLVGRAPESHAARRKFLLKLLPRHAVCAEIGVKRGDFSAMILAIAKPARLHLIDPWFDDDELYESVRRRFDAQIRAGTVIIHRATSSDAAAKFEPASLDWIYIDGDHHYEFVKRDLDDYLSKVKPGGFITGDDYGYPGTWEDGVTRAVDEFIVRGACAPVYLRRHSIKRHSQFMLRKPPAAER
jgi:predicted O-methyltransferase YrrM